RSPRDWRARPPRPAGRRVDAAGRRRARPGRRPPGGAPWLPLGTRHTIRGDPPPRPPRPPRRRRRPRRPGARTLPRASWSGPYAEPFLLETRGDAPESETQPRLRRPLGDIESGCHLT